MKTIYHATVLLFLLGPVWGLQAQTEDFVCKDGHALVAMEKAAAAQQLRFRSSPFTDNYDISYHRMEWAIDPAEYYISGTITTYFEPTEDNFNTIYFDFANELQVNEIKYHGQTLSGYMQNEERLRIELPNAIPMGQLDSISVRYEGAPPSNGFGSFVQSSHGGTPVLWTLSEPYGARDWWPCKQDLNDKIDSIDVYVTTPAEYRVASNGLLVEEQPEAGNEMTYHWRHRYPIPAYLIAIAVTNYASYSDFVPLDDGGSIEVLNYVFPENLTYAQDATSATVDIMELFNELFGLYPFAEEKYGHAQFGWGGGMEHQTMSFMGGFSHLLQAHELAHQWFGNKVTCGSWQDIWLNEGFATYLEGLTYDYGLGPNTFPDWLAGKINHVTSEPGGSVFVTDTSSVGRIFSSRLSYSKGALLLHMLRWKLGDEAFYQGVRNYVDAPALAFGYAKSEDLQFYLEQASGQDLQGFFADWLYGQGYPSYAVQWHQEGSTVYVKIAQSTSHPSVDFFEMPVPVRFTYTDGDSQTQVFEHESNNQIFSFEATSEISEVTFDPELWLLSANNSVEEAVFTSTSTAAAASVSLFPNPTSGAVWLDTQALPNSEPVVLEIYSATGQLLSRSTHPTGQQAAVLLEDYANGLYFYQLWQNDKLLKRGRLVKQ
ncbi:MAG: T9SS type A sorting domain-containing protein [Bacteroidetes bacterium]|jgi:aminopeptidase N|nr:T9SS type A sorting domain-containing protein [Bacteroidota bacterium]